MTSVLLTDETRAQLGELGGTMAATIARAVARLHREEVERRIVFVHVDAGEDATVEIRSGRRE